MPYQGSGNVPAILNCVRHGMPLWVWSQKFRKFGFVAAELQVLAIVRSVAVPPKILAPCGSRALKLNSNALYHCLTLGSFESTFATNWLTGALIVSYIAMACPSIRLQTVTGPELAFCTAPVEYLPRRTV